MAKKINKLDASILTDIHDKAFTQKKVSVTIDGKIYEIKLDTKFEIDKIKNLIIELLKVYENFIKMDKVFDIPVYFAFLVIKYFSDLDFNNITSFEEAVKITKYLDDFGCLDIIIENFDKDEIKKIMDYMKKAEDNLQTVEENPTMASEYTELMQYIETIIDNGDNDV